MKQFEESNSIICKFVLIIFCYFSYVQVFESIVLEDLLGQPGANHSNTPKDECTMDQTIENNNMNGDAGNGNEPSVKTCLLLLNDLSKSNVLNCKYL